MWKILGVVAVVLTGCTSLPSSDDLKAFSDASTKGALAVKTAVVSAETVASHYDQEIVAQRYITHRTMSAIDIPKKQTRLSPEQATAMLGGLANLAAYTEAIGKAADQKTVDELEAAAANLGKSAGKLASLAPVPGAPVAGAALVGGGRLIGYGLADRYTRQILRVIAENDGTVGKLVDLLKSDMDLVLGDVEFQVGDYAAERENSARLIRADPRVTRADLYHEFYAARADIAANQALFDAVSNGQNLLEQIQTTHHKLAVGERDIKRAISRFEASAGDVAALITAIKKESGS